MKIPAIYRQFPGNRVYFCRFPSAASHPAGLREANDRHKDYALAPLLVSNMFRRASYYQTPVWRQTSVQRLPKDRPVLHMRYRTVHGAYESSNLASHESSAIDCIGRRSVGQSDLSLVRRRTRCRRETHKIYAGEPTRHDQQIAKLFTSTARVTQAALCQSRLINELSSCRPKHGSSVHKATNKTMYWSSIPHARPFFCLIQKPNTGLSAKAHREAL